MKHKYLSICSNVFSANVPESDREGSSKIISFGAFILGPLPTQRWKVLFHSIMSSIRIPLEVWKIEVKGGSLKYIRLTLGGGGVNDLSVFIYWGAEVR